MFTPIALALGGFFAVLFALAFWASGRIETEEDFIVAGRSMPGWSVKMSWKTHVHYVVRALIFW